MVERFFSGNSSSLCDDSMILLSGPPSSGKTSLLFQFAFNSVVNSDDKSAVFICSRRKLDMKPPFLSQDFYVEQPEQSGTSPPPPHRTSWNKGIDPSSHVFNRIQMKYVEDEEGINKFFAAFHLHDRFPVLVIIDDFGEFCDERTCRQKYSSPRGRELAIVRTLALCRNAIDHANETGPCMLLFSDTHHGDTPRFLYIYKRWVNSIYTIKGDGVGSFILKHSSFPTAGSCGLEMVRKKSAKYSIALQYLVLEEIFETEDHKATIFRSELNSC